ncbi:hypothetical protein [Cryptosporangium sp. NPDC048952]|uniref:hypothetical protein n=1 Tax=Cryptosporangium sp. NPDC048952 TaxID=3363961 RepID=UPI0037157909
MRPPTAEPGPPFDIAETALRLLCEGPSPLAVSGRALGHGLPRRPIRLTELAAILMHPSASFPARDAVWRLLVTRSRTDGPAWVVGATGVALPGLRAVAGRLGRPGDPDVQAEVLAGFLAALRTLDLSTPKVCPRLCNSAQSAARAALRSNHAGPAEASLTEAAGAAPGVVTVGGHPDFVLARAVRAGVLNVADADLIGAIRLEGIPVREYAARLGLTEWAVYKRRTAAEARLVAALNAGDLDDLNAQVIAEATGTAQP